MYCVCIRVWYVEARGQPQVLIPALPLVLNMVSWLLPVIFTRLTGQKLLGILLPLSPSPQRSTRDTGGCSTASRYTWILKIQTHRHAYAARTLPTEPSPQPCPWIFYGCVCTGPLNTYRQPKGRLFYTDSWSQGVQSMFAWPHVLENTMVFVVEEVLHLVMERESTGGRRGTEARGPARFPV